MFNITPNFDFNPTKDQYNALKYYINKFKEQGEKFNGILADSVWFKDLANSPVQVEVEGIKVEFVESLWLLTEFTSPVIPTWYVELEDNPPSKQELYQLIYDEVIPDYEGEGYDMVEEYYLTK